MEWFINFSTWVETNSGQIQIIIALGAIWLAVKAYKKVQEQIIISNNQTDISLKQTGISIAQMEKLNNERLFELKLRLKTRIGEQSKYLMELQDANNNLSKRLMVLLFDTKENHTESLEAIENMINIWRESITSIWDIVEEKNKENKEYLEDLAKTKDIVVMEEILEKVEQNQIIYQFKMYEIKNLDNHITEIWIPMKKGVSEVLRRMQNFE